MRRALLASTLAVACQADAVDPTPVEDALVDFTAWRESAPADGLDPMPEHRPDEVECALGAWHVDHESTLEVITGACEYFVGSAPTLVDLAPGDTVRLEYLHEPLVVDDEVGDATTGHFLLRVGETTIEEREVELPLDAQAYSVAFEVTAAAAAGTPVTIHLHNHGFNSWRVLSLTRVRAP